MTAIEQIEWLQWVDYCRPHWAVAGQFAAFDATSQFVDN